MAAVCSSLRDAAEDVDCTAAFGEPSLYPGGPFFGGCLFAIGQWGEGTKSADSCLHTRPLGPGMS